jgi:hypothetical protein
MPLKLAGEAFFRMAISFDPKKDPDTAAKFEKPRFLY